jgi:sarcosine/dimethylglycine N-methyltransferase
MTSKNINSLVTVTKEYYDGPADQIYRTIWGDNIHLGIPREGKSDYDHIDAMEHTNEIMAGFIKLTPDSTVLDLGCGYGSAARHLASNYQCHVTGTNISEKELEVASERAAEAKLSHLLQFEYGDFHDLKYTDGSFDVIWSQEAFLHGIDKHKILSECSRVLTPGGILAFTDILVRKDTPQEDRIKIYDRVKSPDMWDIKDYESALSGLGFDIKQSKDWSEHVADSYGWVRDRLQENRASLSSQVETSTIDNTLDALTFWVESANSDKIGWAFLLAEKPGSVHL